MSRWNLFLAGLLVLFSNVVLAKDPISWSLNQPFPNPVLVNGDYFVQYTLRNEIPFTLVNPLNIIKNTSSSEFTFLDQCSGKRLAPGETCLVNVSLNPVSLGTKTASLIIAGYDKNQVPLPPLTTTSAPDTTPRYSVGGNTFGLTGTLVLSNNGTDDITMNADGIFAFPTSLPNGSAYRVTVKNQPINETCSVSSEGVGTIANANVTNIQVHCATNAYYVGGNLNGLAPGGLLLLQNNNAEILPISVNNPFAFTELVAQGAPYSVTVYAHPFNQICSVEDGSGIMGGANVTTVNVICSANAFTLGGTLSGLAPGETVVLDNDVGGTVSLNTNGSFTFPNVIANGVTYDVTVATQPTSQTCQVTSGGTGMITGNVNNVVVSCTTNNTTLQASPSALALSVTGLTEYGVTGTPSSGLPRIVTITNMGSAPANDISISYPAWPSGTTVDTSSPSACTNGINLAASGGSCTITIVPGGAATSNGSTACTNGTSPIPGTISIGADNASVINLDVVVLGYACIYQGGYVFAFDDTTPNTTSVRGKEALVSSTAFGILWSANSGGGYDGGISIWGIDETSTQGSPSPNAGSVFPATKFQGQNNCDGAIDGTCNTNNIYTYYQNFAVGAPVNTTFYAAGYCKSISGYYGSGWYLPAACELNYLPSNGVPINCGTVNAPRLQNMQSNLMENNSLNLVAGRWWTSTELASNSKTQALASFLDTGINNNYLVITTKSNNLINAKCARIFNP